MNTAFSFKRITSDDKILIALFAPFYSSLINSAIVFMLQIDVSHPGFTLFRNISIVIIGLLFLNALQVVIKREPVFISIVVSFLIVLLGMTLLIFPDNIPFLYREGILIYALFVTLPCFIYSYCVRNTEKLYSYLEVYSAIVIGLSFFVMIAMLLFSFGINNSYTMSLGYAAGLASIFYLQKVFEAGKLKDIVLFAIGFILIISIGSRGPLLCLAVFILIYFILNFLKQRITLEKVIGFVFATLCLSLIIYTLGNQEWLIKFNSLLSDFDINSRTLVLLINDNLGHGSGRENIYYYLIQKISEQPLLGYGVGGDRMIVGMYAHNLFLALFTFFGVIGGALSSLAIVFLLLWALLTVKNQNAQAVLMVFFSTQFVSGMISGDMLMDYGLWILIGISMSFLSGRMSQSGKI